MPGPNYQELRERLLKEDGFIIVVHQNPDGDALGSALALARFLEINKKKAAIFSATPYPDNFKFLAGMELVTSDSSALAQAKNIIIVDSGDQRYAGVDKLNLPKEKIINIDHHVSNENFGSLNILNSKAPATAQIVYDFFRDQRIDIDHEMATSLLTGLICDTDNFSNSATTPQSLEAAGYLLRAGANLPLVHRWTLKNSSLKLLKLWGIVLERLEKIEEKSLAYTFITNEDYLRYGISELGAEGIANLLNKIGGVKISLLLRETPDGKVKGSFRAADDSADVSEMAKKLGGGGHKKAAGFTADGTIDEVLKKVLTM